MFYEIYESVSKFVGCPAEVTNKAMQGGNRRQNRRNHPKKPEDPAFRREVRFGDRDGHRGEIQREQFFLSNFMSFPNQCQCRL